MLCTANFRLSGQKLFCDFKNPFKILAEAEPRQRRGEAIIAQNPNSENWRCLLVKIRTFLTKIRIANFDAPPRRRSLTLAIPQKSFLHIFYFSPARFFLLKGKENFFAGFCSERAGRRGFASARARRNSPHTPLPPRPRFRRRFFQRA